MESRSKGAFAVWVTGLPASGKSTLVNALKAQLADQGIDVAVLESDALRKIFTPQPRYDENERDTFYRQMVYLGEMLTQHGVPVIFDATANRRKYRSWARTRIPRFLEVYLDSPLETCMARDPKGIYRQSREGASSSVPGLQSTYEPPGNPDVVVSGDKENPANGAGRVRAKLVEKRFI